MNKNHKILAITLARGGSKRVPRKNIKNLSGKPLLQYTTDEVKKSKYINKYIVSTDDNEIINFCINNNIDYHKRPDEFAQDTSTSASAIQDVLNNYSDYDIIVEIMCTNPLKKVKHIDECIEKLINNNYDSVVSVVRIWDNHPSRVKYIKDDLLESFYPEIPESRRQDLTPEAYVRNGSIYTFWKSSFNKYGNRLGEKCSPYIMPEENTINIDEPVDFELAELIINKSKDNSIDYESRLDGGCSNEW